MTNKTDFGWVLRDMMQSTGVWCFESQTLQTMAQLAAKAGFKHIEIGGGQSYQIAMQRGFNPYRLISEVKSGLDNAEQAVQPQILLRGANQFGFHHYSTNTQASNLDLLIEAGGDADASRALVIRIFDALNDVENLRFCIEHLVSRNLAAAERGGKRVNIQVALSYVAPAVDASIPENERPYSVDYYLAYAKALRKIAQDKGGDLDSICIKDMSSQLSVAEASKLIKALKTIGLPVTLHCHSTDEGKSTASLLVAAESGANRIEVAVEPLAGGASHNRALNFEGFEAFNPLDSEALTELRQLCHDTFAHEIHKRKDFLVPLGSLKRLCGLGIPGGAIPFIVHDLEDQVVKMLGADLDEAINQFADELARVQALLGNVPLVTPTADIIAKQVIKNLGNRARSPQYKLMDPRFCALVLGHYGDVVNHATGKKVHCQQSLIDEVSEYCAGIEVDPLNGRVKAGKVFPEPELVQQHPSQDISDDEYLLSQEYVRELTSRYPESVARFGSDGECAMMQVMRPAGNSERLLTRNILSPTEERLRRLLKETLGLLPMQMIPESRDRSDNEETDIALLSLLGGYEGIIENIKDLVMHTDNRVLHDRLEGLKDNIVGQYCSSNAEAEANRLYVERRFVALFAAAVFWDLQRICRRTGSDSRSDINEVTANSLGNIISVTLRERKEAGIGRSENYLV